MDSAEWDKKIREYGMSKWLSRNPGKTEKDYDEDWNRRQIQIKKATEAREKRKVEDAIMNVFMFIYNCINYIGYPALVAWVLTWFLPIAFLPTFMAMIIILHIIRRK